MNEIILRKEAKSLGLKKYFTGKMCKYGHIAERQVQDGKCIECRDLYYKNNKDMYRKSSAAYKKRNPLKIKEQWQNYYQRDAVKKARSKYYKDYYIKNEETIVKRKKQWYIENPRYNKQYRECNPSKISLLIRQYLQSKKCATPRWYESELIKRIYLKRNELSKLWNIVLHVDHIIPLQGKNVCGLHCWDNLQLLEASLNSRKSNKLI